MRFFNGLNYLSVILLLCLLQHNKSLQNSFVVFNDQYDFSNSWNVKHNFLRSTKRFQQPIFTKLALVIMHKQPTTWLIQFFFCSSKNPTASSFYIHACVPLYANRTSTLFLNPLNTDLVDASNVSCFERCAAAKTNSVIPPIVIACEEEKSRTIQ